MDENRQPGNTYVESISLADREALIRAIPVFQTLQPTEIAALAGLMREVEFAAEEIIVREGELVDCAYIIADGRAEVTKQIDQTKQKGETLLATLNKGETIGLSETGIYTTTGVRTATVRAVQPCRLLKLTLVDLNQFVNKHPSLNESLRKSTDWMLHMRFIKSAAPFAQFSNERIAWLANLVKEINVEENTVIFKEGDAADSCYLICDGKVEIVKKKPDNVEKQLAILEAFNLFGEAALVTSVTRNASARTLTKCRLLLLDREALRELITKEGQASDYLITLMKGRSKPIRADNIIHHQRISADGEKLTTLKNPERGSYFQLSEEGWFIWRELDGKKTLEEITIDFSKQFKQFNPDFVSRVIIELASQGFAFLDVSKEAFELSTGFNREPTKIERALNATMAISQPDKKFDWLYRNMVFILYTIPAIIVLALLTVGGLISFFLTFGNAVNQFKDASGWLILFIFAFYIGMVLRIARPLAQAFAVKRFKHEVNHFTLGLHWLMPVAYVDLADMWLAPRWQRTLVNFAGLFAELMVAGLLSIYAYYTSGLLSWLCALFIYLHILRSLDPMLDMDGYQTLAGLLNVPELRNRTIIKLINFKNDYKEGMMNWCKKNRTECLFLAYWLVYSSLLIGFVVLIQNELLQNLLFEYHFLRWLIPCVFVMLIMVNMLLEIRDQYSLENQVK